MVETKPIKLSNALMIFALILISIPSVSALGNETHTLQVVSYPSPNHLHPQTCYEILNLTENDTVTLSIDNNTFTIVENFVSPTSAGITINGQSLFLVPNTTRLFAAEYYAYLLVISYLPILHPVTLLVCGIQTAQQIPTTTTPTTTVPPSNSTLSTLAPLIGTGVAIAIAIALGIAYAGRRARRRRT